MLPSTYAQLKTGNILIHDGEVELVNHLATVIEQAGVRTDRIDVANFYVALKHRRMAVLAGPPGSGKAALVESLANLLTGSNGLQRQVALGHARYAGVGTANSILINMHTRLITDKFLFLLNEALKPENAQRVFIVGMTHISPAELLSFFTEVAYQIQHNQIMRIGDTHLSSPIPFPSNLLLIGTLDTTDFDDWDEDLLSGATVIEWHGDMPVPESAVTPVFQIPGLEFLRSSLRNSQKACKKLLSIIAGNQHPLKVVMLVQDVLQSHGLGFLPDLLDDVILYLANAWSAQGNGLFNPSLSRNLAVASDLAVAQLVLPHYFMALRSSETLQADLCSILGDHLPRSRKYLKEHFVKGKKD
jgi:energy-coupling factor transporter ATP-binding protein EcfA2